MSEKLFYTMGEVTEMFDVNSSLLRYWESRFKQLQPKRNNKGNRLYRSEDVEFIKLLYHLLKERGMTIEGARKSLQERNTDELSRESELFERLHYIRQLLVEVRETLMDDPGKTMAEEEVEPDPEPQPEADTVAPARETPLGLVAEKRSVPEPAPDFSSESESASKHDPEAECGSKTECECEPGPEAAATVEAVVETQAEVKAEIEPQAKPEPDFEPDSEPEPEPEPVPGPVPMPRAQSDADHASVFGPETDPDSAAITHPEAPSTEEIPTAETLSDPDSVSDNVLISGAEAKTENLSQPESPSLPQPGAEPNPDSDPGIRPDSTPDSESRSGAEFDYASMPASVRPTEPEPEIIVVTEADLLGETPAAAPRKTQNPKRSGSPESGDGTDGTPTEISAEISGLPELKKRRRGRKEDAEPEKELFAFYEQRLF